MRGEAEEQRANGRITEGVERQADGVQLEANVDIEPLGIKHVRISREMRHARRRRQATQHDASHTRVGSKGDAAGGGFVASSCLSEMMRRVTRVGESISTTHVLSRLVSPRLIARGSVHVAPSPLRLLTAPPRRARHPGPLVAIRRLLGARSSGLSAGSPIYSKAVLSRPAHPIPPGRLARSDPTGTGATPLPPLVVPVRRWRGSLRCFRGVRACGRECRDTCLPTSLSACSNTRPLAYQAPSVSPVSKVRPMGSVASCAISRSAR